MQVAGYVNRLAWGVHVNNDIGARWRVGDDAEDRRCIGPIVNIGVDRHLAVVDDVRVDRGIGVDGDVGRRNVKVAIDNISVTQNGEVGVHREIIHREIHISRQRISVERLQLAPPDLLIGGTAGDNEHVRVVQGARVGILTNFHLRHDQRRTDRHSEKNKETL